MANDIIRLHSEAIELLDYYNASEEAYEGFCNNGDIDRITGLLSDRERAELESLLSQFVRVGKAVISDEGIEFEPVGYLRGREDFEMEIVDSIKGDTVNFFPTYAHVDTICSGQYNDKPVLIYPKFTGDDSRRIATDWRVSDLSDETDGLHFWSVDVNMFEPRALLNGPNKRRIYVTVKDAKEAGEAICRLKVQLTENLIINYRSPIMHGISRLLGAGYNAISRENRENRFAASADERAIKAMIGKRY
ncbi:MAG: hypothetical protein HY518_02570 [Candidatus Aenigmarchaeota archaeon]|nr:hypothetical protein [Candidatus Aenigmarchaeota archaeon]